MIKDNISWNSENNAFVSETSANKTENFEFDGRHYTKNTISIKRHIKSVANKIDKIQRKKQVWITYVCQNCGWICHRNYFPIPNQCDVNCGHTCETIPCEDDFYTLRMTDGVCKVCGAKEQTSFKLGIAPLINFKRIYGELNG